MAIVVGLPPPVPVRSLVMDKLPNIAVNENVNGPQFSKKQYGLKEFQNVIKNLEITVKVNPILLSCSGLSDVRAIAAKHLDAIRGDSKAKGATDQFAAESNFELVLLSTFEELFASQKEVPSFDSTISSAGCTFNTPELDQHLHFVYESLLSKQGLTGRDSAVPQNDETKSETSIKSVYEINVINIWSFAINRMIRHFLASMQGHLYNHYMWLFLDLEDNIDNLDKPPECAELMSWRPLLHYLLRSCKISEDKEKGSLYDLC